MSLDYTAGYLAGLRAAYTNPGSILVLIEQGEQKLAIRQEQARQETQRRIEAMLIGSPETDVEEEAPMAEQLQSARREAWTEGFKEGAGEA